MVQMSLLTGVRGTLLEVKYFRNILEFNSVHNMPSLSTEIIFQMAILSVLRLRWIPTNTTHFSFFDCRQRPQDTASHPQGLEFNANLSKWFAMCNIPWNVANNLETSVFLDECG